MRSPGFLLAMLVAGLLAGSGKLHAQQLIELEEIPDEAKKDTEYLDHLEKKKAMRERLAEQDAQLRSSFEDRVKALETERKTKLEPQATATVEVDGQTLNVTEPNSAEQALDLKKPVRDHYEVSPDDFSLYEHDRWSLNKSDFQFDRPQYIVADGQAGRTRRWFVFTFSITNSSTKARRIAPVIVAVTNNGAFTPAVGGFIPERLAADSTYHPLAHGKAARDEMWLKDNVLPMESLSNIHSHRFGAEGFQPLANPPEPMATFAPGQTRWGVAVWPSFDDELTELKLVVHGLSNAHRYDRKQRHALVIGFTRNDDEFHVERSMLKYGSKEFEYLWMWDQDLTVPLPSDPNDARIKEKKLATPSGGERFLWTFPYEIANSSPTTQSIKVKEVAFALRGSENKGVEVDVGGQKVLVEIKVVDDGRSSIYKAQFLREANLSDPAKEIHRFAPSAENQKYKLPGGMVFTIKTGEKIESRAVFDAQDVDWTDLRQQVEDQLSLAKDKKAASEETWKQATKKIANEHNKLAEQNPGILYDPRRKLTDDNVVLKDGRSFTGLIKVNSGEALQIETPSEGLLSFTKEQVETVTEGEFSTVRKQVLEAIPAAVEAAKQKKRVTAYFSCEAGISTGSYRIARWYRIPGKIDEEWLKAWETLDAGE